MDHGRLRPARLDEAAALEDLMREASMIWDDHREDLLAHPDAIEVPRADLRAGRVRVHEVDGTVTGFATVLPLPDGTAELDALFVRPALMRHGIGARLVEDAARRGARRWRTGARGHGGPARRDVLRPLRLPHGRRGAHALRARDRMYRDLTPP